MTEPVEPQPPRGDGIFREEALRHYLDRGVQGEVLRLAPAWARWSYWLLLGLVAVSAAYLTLARIDEYASGPAIVVEPGMGSRTTVVAFLPERTRPLLRPGMPLRFAPDGFPTGVQRLRIDAIDDEILGPEEARRRLGVGADDSRIAGPVSSVRADLPAAIFTYEGRRIPYRKGMTGSAEIPVRSERLIFALLPFRVGGKED